ncbi:hypothetical protein EON65_50470 [archaeon]|nr:MAG: hypothetical protein EON65_50470 [archaeon]
MSSSSSEGLKESIKAHGMQADEPGRKLILRSLTTDLKTDPWTQISSLQDQLSLGNPASKPLLHFLSCMGVSNVDAHLSLFESLKEKVEVLVLRLDEAQLLELLRETALLLSLRDLRSIPLAIIRRMSKVPPQFLKVVAEKNLLQVCGHVYVHVYVYA